MAVVIDSEIFHSHLSKIHDHWSKNRTLWGEADALCIPIPKFDEENDGMYSKTTSVSRYLLGHEFLSTILLLTRNELHILTSDKKAKILAPLKDSSAGSVKVYIHIISKDDKNAGNFSTLVRAIKGSYHGTRLGIPAKDISVNGGVDGNLASVWLEHVREKAGLAIAEIGRGLSKVMAVKDATEMSLVQKAAVMSNKVMKHGFLKEMESIFEAEGKIKHNAMAEKLDNIMDDPSKIGIKVAPNTIESCYFPIVQSGGNKQGFNIKPSASTDDGVMTEDVIIVSLGARFKSYCANIARTFVIDDVPTVKKTYAALVRTRAECLAVMQVGSKLSEVHAAATAFLDKKHKSLLPSLPKSLGFSLGLDFKDSIYSLTGKVDPSYLFEPGMVFNLAIGFQDVEVPLAEREKAKGSIKNLGKFSMLVADTVKINPSGIPEVLTKASIEWDDINYNIKEGEESNDEEDEEEDDDDAMNDDDEGIKVKTAAGRATVLKSRLRERVAIGDDQLEAKQKRAEKQQRLFERARDRGKRLLASGKGGGGGGASDDKQVKAEDFKAYASSELYPYESKGNMIYVDMDNEAILLPINGLPVPFHISTVKSVNMPDPDAGAYLRLNFYSPDQALGKDAPPQMAALVNRFKEGDQTFIKEFTFRSLNPAPLNHAFRQIQELRKRMKQKAVAADQEATLVVQPKLIRLKDQRVPRLADIEMRPALSGRKSKGTIDAHANGLRFTSTKTGEHVDIMYVNIKHAFFQPCHSEHIVLIHFHLLNPIMVAKKKTTDVQFITEVVEASEEVTARGSAYDPDEIESEQRERKMRKVLNRKFQEYTVKVEEVAKKHGFDSLEFDIPYKDLAFQGTPNREMVTLQPSVHCLVNLTETPAFVVSMTSIEHVHFERCTMGAKNFDMVFVPKKHQEPVKMVSMVNMKDFDDIQEWITQQDITFTIGTVNFNWKQTMAMVDGFLEDGTFWDEEDEEGESKPPGWLFLNAGTGESDEEEEEDDEDAEEYKEESGDDEESSSEEGSDDDDDESFDEEDDDEDDYDEEEEEEADGQDWEDLEREAKASDRQREAYEQEEERKAPPTKKSKTRR